MLPQDLGEVGNAVILVKQYFFCQEELKSVVIYSES